MRKQLKSLFALFLLTGMCYFASGLNYLSADTDGEKYGEYDGREAGQTSARFLEFSPSVRACGMGEAFVGIADLSGISINPAGLAFLKYKEITLMHSKLYQGNKLDFLTGVIPFKEKYALGLNILFFDMPEEPVYDWDGQKTEENIFYYGGAIGLAGAAKVSKNLSIGINIKNVSEEICELKGKTMAFDIGGLYKYPIQKGILQLGLAVNNAGGKIKFDEDAHDTPQIFRLGAAYIQKDLTLSMEFSRVDREDITIIKLGAEYWINDTIAPRLGFKAVEDAGGFSLGFGLKYMSFSLDYAFLPHKMLGATHRMAAGLKFGVPAVEKEKKPREAKPKVEKPKPVKVKKEPGKLSNIAVAELDGKNVSAMDAAIVSDFIRTELVRTQAFKVLDRQNMESVLAEQSFQMTGCTTEECAVQMGKILNVRYMAVGSFSKFLETYYININFIDVETGQIVGAESQECASGKELPSAAQKIATSFAEQFGQ